MQGTMQNKTIFLGEKRNPHNFATVYLDARTFWYATVVKKENMNRLKVAYSLLTYLENEYQLQHQNYMFPVSTQSPESAKSKNNKKLDLFNLHIII